MQHSQPANVLHGIGTSLAIACKWARGPVQQEHNSTMEGITVTIAQVTQRQFKYQGKSIAIMSTCFGTRLPTSMDGSFDAQHTG